MSWRRLSALLRPSVDREVDDELAFHLEMRAREIEEQGMEPRAARAAAERRFADLQATRRACRQIAQGRNRDERRREWWGELGQDLGFALRQMGKNRSFTALAVATLALGLGATAAIFSVLHAVVLRPLPFPESQRIHLVATTWRGSPTNVSAGNYVYIQERQRSFAPLSAVDYRRFNLALGDVPERVSGAAVTHDYFAVFGLRPALGRTFSAEEDAPGRDRVVVLSHAFWVRRFGADPKVLGRAMAPPGVPRLEAARIDAWTLAFAMATSVVASVIFGLVPATQASKLDLRSGLVFGGRSATGAGGRDRLRRALVVAEVALSLTLLAGAGLLVRTGLNLGQASLGFEPEGLLTARVGFPKEGYATHEKTARAFEAVIEHIRAQPGVRAVALVSKLPLSESSTTNGLIPEGRSPDAKSAINTDLQIVSPGYFDAMRIPLRAGRTLTADDRRDAPRVMVIGEELARVAFPGQDAVGRRIACCEAGVDGSPPWKVVVGVVGNVSTSGPGAPPTPQFYLPLDQVPAEAWDWTSRTLALVVRGGPDPAALAPVVREAVRSVDPSVPVYDVQTMAERRRETTAQERFGAVLLSALGALGLVLAAVGIYGVIAYFVSQRTREIAVRLAMGAQTRDVVALVFRQGLRPALLGMALGVAGALAAGRALRAMLFGVGVADPVTLVAVAALLFVVAGLASVLPARRAARVDPARALAEG